MTAVRLQAKRAWIFEVMGDQKLTVAQRLVGVAIAEHMHLESGRCDPSYTRLAHVTALGRSTVIYAVAALVRRGHLGKRIDPKTGRNRFALKVRDLLTELEGGPPPRTPPSPPRRTGGVRGAGRGESTQLDPNGVLNSVLNSAAAAPRLGHDLEELEVKLRRAAGLENSPSAGLLIVGPIAGLLEAGYDLELDVLPVLRSRRGRNGAKAPRSWGYFVPAIEQARAERVGIASRPAPGASKRPGELEEQWRGRYRVWCRSRTWHPLWGPTPEEPGCKLPQRVRDQSPGEPSA